jgi:hypothetical protein
MDILFQLFIFHANFSTKEFVEYDHTLSFQSHRNLHWETGGFEASFWYCKVCSNENQQFGDEHGLGLNDLELLRL